MERKPQTPARAETDEIEKGLAVVTDWHYGSHTCLEHAAREFAGEIKREGYWWIGLGDLGECAIRTSLGDIYKQVLSPKEQLDGLGEILAPIADQCLGLVSGNHGRRTEKEVGIHFDHVLADSIGVPYYGAKMFMLLHIGEAYWRVLAHHTTGGGTMQSGKINVLEKMNRIAKGMDLYLGGHTHATGTFCSDSFDLRSDGTRVRIRQRYSAGGSLLDYDGSYADDKGYEPAPNIQYVHFLGQPNQKARPYNAKHYRREERQW